jgi:Spy/CpxP family protein refolding chaperone
MIRSMIMALMAGVLVIAPLSSMAQDQPPAPDKHPHKMWTDLGLTEEQKEKLKELHQEMKTVRTGHMEQIKALRQKAKEELLKEKPSRNTLNALARNQGDIEQKFAEKRLEHLLKLKGVLTSEQFTKFVDREWSGPRKCPPNSPENDAMNCPKHRKGKHGRGMGVQGGEGPGPQGNGPQAEEQPIE